MNASRRFFLVIAPILWSACSLLHFEYPGDEYGMWVSSSVAGSWVVLFMHNIGDIRHSLVRYYVAGAGALTFAGAGWILLELRASARTWAKVWGCLAILIPLALIGRFESPARAIAKNGSITAYVLFGILSAATLTSVLMIIEMTFWRLFGRTIQSKLSAFSRRNE